MTTSKRKNNIMTILTNYICNEFYHVSPLPVDNYSHFKIQIVNGDNSLKTKFINITLEQFKQIEKILLTE